MGPELPQGLGSHAIISINKTLSLLIGGKDADDVMDSTYYFSHETEQWRKGPKLIQSRHSHTAGLITDKITNETFAIVVGGQNRVSTDLLNTTEILIEGVWVLGENLHSINILVQFSLPTFSYLFQIIQDQPYQCHL